MSSFVENLKTRDYVIWGLILSVIFLLVLVGLQMSTIANHEQSNMYLRSMLNAQLEAEADWCNKKGAAVGTVYRNEEKVSIYCVWPNRGADGIFYPPHGGDK